MSSVVNLGRKIGSFETSPQFDGYTRVVVIVSDDLEYSAGTDTGRTLTVNNPWGTQEMAENILKKIGGYKYQPYVANDAILDPAAELGDGISVNSVYSGIFTRKINFGTKCRATVSAPSEEEIDHEYPYVPKQERKVTRNLRQLTSELLVQAGLISAEVKERKSDVESINGKLTVQATQITAKVEKTGGNSSSFGWVLDDSSWTIKANGTDILKATKNGLEVYGKVTATSGKIGGFDIKDNYISYNNQTWGGTNTTGIYIGIKGIQLGKSFKVDSAGNLTAASGTFTGAVHAGNIQYGGNAGYFSGGGISSGSISGNRLRSNTVTTAYTSGGINSSLGYADFANGVFNGWNTAEYLTCRRLASTGTISCPTLRLNSRTVEIKSMSVATPGGGSATLNYLGWVY